MKVTFDNSTLKEVVTPDRCVNSRDHAAFVAVHEALKSGRVRGYFGDSILTLDSLGREDKVNVIGSASIESRADSTGPYTLTLTIGARWNRTKPINAIFLARIQAALSLGMRALVGPRRLGDTLSVQGFGDSFYVPNGTPEEFVACATKTNALDQELWRRGIGRGRAVNLGLAWSEREGTAGEWWPKGLGRHRNSAEREEAHKAINEWADGDAVAAHVGYGNDLFCTHDFAGDAGETSVFHCSNRDWLTTAYGLKFVTLPELAEQITK
jgi:hypothetical protein